MDEYKEYFADENKEIIKELEKIKQMVDDLLTKLGNKEFNQMKNEINGYESE